MRKGNLFFLILLVSIFAFSLYALEKQGTPLVKKEKSAASSEKGVGECCKEGKSPLSTTHPLKEEGLQAKGEKKTVGKEEAGASKKSKAEKEPSSEEVKKRKKGEEEEKEIASEEEEEEEFEEYEEGDEPFGPEEEEGVDFQTY